MTEDYNFLKHHPPLNSLNDENDLFINSLFFVNNCQINNDYPNEFNYYPQFPDFDDQKDKYLSDLFNDSSANQFLSSEDSETHKLKGEISLKNSIEIEEEGNSNIGKIQDEINSINSTIKSKHKDEDENEKIIKEKLDGFISSYNNFLTAQVCKKSSNKIFNDLDENLKIAEKTLPGWIISLMKKENKPITEQFIYLNSIDKFFSFRKANGAKYKGDPRNVIKSTLRTSGIFYKVNGSSNPNTSKGSLGSYLSCNSLSTLSNDQVDLFFYKEHESMEFILKAVSREFNKKIKDTSKLKQNSTKAKSKSNNPQKLSLYSQICYKISKVNNILANMINKCKGQTDAYKDLRKKVRNEGIEMLKKISEEDKYIGIILCIKYFKDIVEKYIKMNKKKKSLKNFNKKNFNMMILSICDKFEEIERRFKCEIGEKDEVENAVNLVDFAEEEEDIYSDLYIFWQMQEKLLEEKTSGISKGKGKK